jgi:elongation factor 2
MWNTEFSGFELVPNNMVKEVVVAIRKRKGLKEQMPTPADYLSVV